MRCLRVQQRVVAVSAPEVIDAPDPSVTEEATRRTPAAGEWSIAEVVDHVTLTLEDAMRIMRALAAGRPASPMTDHTPASAGKPLGELVAHLRKRHTAVSEFLTAQTSEPHPALRVADSYFGEINWKGYALILRLHYKDHAQQIQKTRAAIGG